MHDILIVEDYALITLCLQGLGLRHDLRRLFYDRAAHGKCDSAISQYVMSVA